MLALIDQAKFPSVMAFVYNEVLEMGVESGDCTLLLTPLVLKICINTVLIDKNTQARLPSLT